MDRSLKKGCIGLSIVWLRGDMPADKSVHDALKGVLSAADSFDVRCDGRQAFETLARDNGGAYQEVFDEEARFRSGDRSEPQSLPDSKALSSWIAA